jgi:hypothetical protein
MTIVIGHVLERRQQCGRLLPAWVLTVLLFGPDYNERNASNQRQAA